jgi:hypothetical protein
MNRRFITAVLLLGAFACTKPDEQRAPAETQRPADSQHAGITTPHGDHSPHHGGIVLMKGELHYEVVVDAQGRHAVWFSDAIREDLPASVASKVAMTVARPNRPGETLALAIDDSGESWVASGQPLSGSDIMVTLSFVARGEPFEIEIPFIEPARAQK